MPKIAVIGIDPGTTNLGICVLNDNLQIAELFQISIERDKNPINRIQHTQKILNECVRIVPYEVYMIIEGASFGSNFRQVELAECRTSAALWALDRKFKVQIIPPTTIRKNVFGSAKIKAHEIWSNIPSDCAAALSCALSVNLYP